LLGRWNAATQHPKADPEGALVRDRPKIAVVTATTTTAMDDIRAQMWELEAAVEVQVHSIAMTRPDEVAKAVRRAAPQADLLVVTRRGGGTAVEDLDADELIQAIVDYPVLVVVGVGHASEVLSLGRVTPLVVDLAVDLVVIISTPVGPGGALLPMGPRLQRRLLPSMCTCRCIARLLFPWFDSRRYSWYC
jgi:hypothetical protein